MSIFLRLKQRDLHLCYIFITYNNETLTEESDVERTSNWNAKAIRVHAIIKWQEKL